MTADALKLYRRAYYLALVTIFYNLVEGIVSVALGFEDETLSLFGFGIDSFIEVISGIGILWMVLRIRRNPESEISAAEITALRITGYGFYLLALGLAAGTIMNVIYHHVPVTTYWGIIISLVSIGSMSWLSWMKFRTGKALNSDPVIADGNCTLVCLYMSVVLLLASGIYEFTGFSYADAIGAAGLTWFSFSEGREALKKAKLRTYSD
jgi:divalent metal cation (Fe/Co/Zn/Cd) transporter